MEKSLPMKVALPTKAGARSLRGRPLLAALVLGLGTAPGPLGAPTARPEDLAALPGFGVADPIPDLATDPRVRAFLQAYGPLIDDVTYLGDDAVFTARGHVIHFLDGRMLAKDHLAQADEFEPFFFRYSLGPLREPLPAEDGPGQSTDVLEAFFGRTEAEIRLHCASAAFLGRRLFVNTLLLEPLQGVERDILAAAKREPEVAKWLGELKVAYSFMDKGIAGSNTRSYHAWGLAVDLVPESYGGKEVYWRWSRVFNREGWSGIPLSQRWRPPRAVVEAFQRHGFVWGGKWAHFDQIHFESRPEILLYNQALAD